ncbi:hypothetical protein [Microbaculum marinum]|uniref:DUF3311 domain-containing protein n=1 Tax=Microbaculum marinum TaxID=1764581 RepID=A0AAW9RUP8_9HYPH
MTGVRDSGLRRRKYRDAALVLPFAGVFLLMPPFIRIFVSEGNVAGIPTIILYLFGVWFALILCAWLLARPLRDVMPGEAEGSEPEIQEG